MNLEKVIFSFFIILALTLNFGFFIGDIDNPDHHEIVELFLAIIVNLIATGLKLGDRSQIGSVLLSTSSGGGSAADRRGHRLGHLRCMSRMHRAHVPSVMASYRFAIRRRPGRQHHLGLHAGGGNPDDAALERDASWNLKLSGKSPWRVRPSSSRFTYIILRYMRRPILVLVIVYADLDDRLDPHSRHRCGQGNKPITSVSSTPSTSLPIPSPPRASASFPTPLHRSPAHVGDRVALCRCDRLVLCPRFHRRPGSEPRLPGGPLPSAASPRGVATDNRALLSSFAVSAIPGHCWPAA